MLSCDLAVPRVDAGKDECFLSPSDFSQSYKNNYYPLGPEATCQIHKSSEIPEWHLDFLLLSGLLFSSSTPVPTPHLLPLTHQGFPAVRRSRAALLCPRVLKLYMTCYTLTLDEKQHAWCPTVCFFGGRNESSPNVCGVRARGERSLFKFSLSEC